MKYWSGVFTWTSESNVFIVLYGEIKTQNMSYTMALLLPVWPSSQQNALQLSHLRQWAQRCHGSIMPSNQKTGLGLIAFLREVWVMILLAYNQGRLWAVVRKQTQSVESPNRNIFSYGEGGRKEGREKGRKIESTCQMAPSLGKFQPLCHVFVVPLGGWNCLHLCHEMFHAQDRFWVTVWVIRLNASLRIYWSDNGTHRASFTIDSISVLRLCFSHF